MNRTQGRVAAVGLVAVVAIAMAGCQNLDAPQTGSSDVGTLTVGFVTPLTGSLAAFGEPDQWVVDELQTWFDDNPLEVGGEDVVVDIRIEDSGSTADGASQAAQKLLAAGADVLLAHATPETTVPVSLQCIDAEVPCITADTPLEPWALSVHGVANPADLVGAEPLAWVHHFFWGLGDVAAVYQDIWTQVDTNKKVAGLFPNDSDGQAWSGALPGILEDSGNGYTLDVPTLYDPGTTDFTSLINTFKANGDEILTGVVPPADFAAFWQQAQQQGWTPKVVSVAKAIEFPAAIQAFDDPIGFTTEVWWTPTAPFSSSLTGQSADELASAYEDATGKQWTVALGFSHALFEVLVAAISSADSIEGADIDAAAGALAVDSIVGPLDFTAGPYPNTAASPLVGGQWVEGDRFPYDLAVVANDTAPEIPLGGEVQPLQ